ncbi:hypothetical protein [Caballeronia sp. LZ001]|uniref:hypothetical protein n=1 Tax=Caballeronia sp. LZ001 TaxID=3038553 RepID=UPI00285AFD72|nr:hypothetical protein [Caballeronia sp. LZ001]MDR5799447.1 hypothetical protein [Caballeronia sp. LZ001]
MKKTASSILCCAVALTGLIGSIAAHAEERTVPGNTQSGSGASGKSAGTAGGAGAAGKAGTDPTTLARTEEERVKQKNAKSSGSGKADSKRKDWKD